MTIFERAATTDSTVLLGRSGLGSRTAVFLGGVLGRSSIFVGVALLGKDVPLASEEEVLGRRDWAAEGETVASVANLGPFAIVLSSVGLSSFLTATSSSLFNLFPRLAKGGCDADTPFCWLEKEIDGIVVCLPPNEKTSWVFVGASSLGLLVSVIEVATGTGVEENAEKEDVVDCEAPPNVFPYVGVAAEGLMDGMDGVKDGALAESDEKEAEDEA